MAEKNYKITLRGELIGLLFLAMGVFFGLSIVSYDPADPALNVTSTVAKINNLGGVVGAYTADVLFSVFGISAYFLCAVLFLISFMQLLGRVVRLNWKEALSYAIMVISIAAVFHLRFETIRIHSQPIEAGGLLGGIMAELLRRWLGIAGAYVTTLTVSVVTLLYATHLSVFTVARVTKSVLAFLASNVASYSVIYFERLRKWLTKSLPVVREKIVELVKKYSNRKKVKINVKAKVATAEPQPKPIEAKAAETAEVAETKVEGAETATGPKIFERADSKPSKVKDSQLELARMSKNYAFPQISLLDSPEQKVNVIDEDSLKRNSVLLEKKLKDYGVEGRVTEIHPGPVITMYEFEPAPGVKVGKIVNLEDDLSVTMGGRSVRIVAHLPGKAAIGIEIPNTEREIVWLKDIISDPKFRRSGSRITFALGKNIEGHPVITDLTKMPHLLVAGATGSGKSVAINTMIVSTLYKATPEEVRMILIDPKMLELPVYDGIPHLLLPVVTKPRKAVLALQWAVREMERRYNILADATVRNISGYNEKFDKGLLKVVSVEEAAKLQEENKEIVCHTGKLPYIMIVIDELADLMMVATKEMEESITRLAQMARAAGIHLILATQRPSVDVITGLIKANFPARMAFKVSGQHDSRTIIDTVGAEKLLGMGDMLFMPPNTSDILRLHGAFVTEAEISRIVSHIKEQGKPVYDESITAEPATPDGGIPGVDAEYDELYDSAVKLVAETKQASISMIQRRFRIGYNRAARLIEKMESEGVVGPADGAKPREVLVSSFERGE
jgi:S-DNA-T family DNA segregation ATPase FtsK/SpoIIIE